MIFICGLDFACIAQWVEHQTFNLGVPGSSPGTGIKMIIISSIIRKKRKNKMGITCKPMGTLKKMMKQVDNEQIKEKEASKENNKREKEVS